MRPDGVPDLEMLRKPRPQTPFGARRFGKRADPLAPQYLQSGEWYDVADLLDAASAPASASELAGEREIVAAFQREHLESVSASSKPARRRSLVRSRMLNSLLTGKIAAALAAAAVGATGAATAAYADALPASVQDIAHHLIAAPPAHSHASDTGRDHGHEFASPQTSPSPSVSASTSTVARHPWVAVGVSLASDVRVTVRFAVGVSRPGRVRALHRMVERDCAPPAKPGRVPGQALENRRWRR